MVGDMHPLVITSTETLKVIWDVLLCAHFVRDTLFASAVLVPAKRLSTHTQQTSSTFIMCVPTLDTAHTFEHTSDSAQSYGQAVANQSEFMFTLGPNRAKKTTIQQTRLMTL